MNIAKLVDKLSNKIKQFKKYIREQIDLFFFQEFTFIQDEWGIVGVSYLYKTKTREFIGKLFHVSDNAITQICNGKKVYSI